MTGHDQSAAQPYDDALLDEHRMEDHAAKSAATVERTPAMVMRGTPADAPKVRWLLDEVAAKLPNDDLGHALYRWAEEVTRLVEGRD